MSMYKNGKVDAVAAAERKNTDDEFRNAMREANRKRHQDTCDILRAALADGPKTAAEINEMYGTDFTNIGFKVAGKSIGVSTKEEERAFQNSKGLVYRKTVTVFYLS